jgi:HSP20 family molecular chaperone IbpA
MTMSRGHWIESPLLIGFDSLRLAAERASAVNDGFPPYNVEVLDEHRLQIAIAVAGFEQNELLVEEQGRHLIIEGAKSANEDRQFVHRGIATRRFRRVFVLADGFEVVTARLKNGLLEIEAARPQAREAARRIPIHSE